MPMNAGMRPDKLMHVSFDLIVETQGWPPEEALNTLCGTALAAAVRELGQLPGKSFCLLFTDDAAMRDLNTRFRNQAKPTNVLSFPAASGDEDHLGDIALGQETVFREAQEKSIPVSHHIAHLVVHGYLHLQGYDHQTEAEAEQMESIERKALQHMEITDPYEGDQQ